MTTTTRMSHAERRERRRKLAEAVRTGRLLSDICGEFGLGAAAVQRACIEFGVNAPDGYFTARFQAEMALSLSK